MEGRIHTDIASASDYFSFLVPVPVKPKSTTVQLLWRTSCNIGGMLVPHRGWDLFPLLHIHSYNKMPITLANWNESVPCNQKKLIKTIRKYIFKNRQCDNNDCIEWCIKININAPPKKNPYSDGWQKGGQKQRSFPNFNVLLTSHYLN